MKNILKINTLKFRQISVLNLGLQSNDRLELDVKIFPSLCQGGGICSTNGGKSSLSIEFSSGGIHGGNEWIQWSVPIHTLSIMRWLVLLLEFNSLIWKDMSGLNNECTSPIIFFFWKMLRGKGNVSIFVEFYD